MTENTNVATETPEQELQNGLYREPKEELERGPTVETKPVAKKQKKSSKPKTPKKETKVTTATATKTKIPVAKKTVKTPTPKTKAPIKAVKPSTNGKAPSNEIRWTEIRVKVLNALKSLKATGATNGATSADIATKVKCEAHTIKHYCYKDEQLVKFGFVGIAAAVEGPGLTYYLTAKGQKVTPTVA